MNKFNVLYIENFTDIIGGGQRSLLDVLEKLNKERFQPMVVCPSRGSLVEALQRLNIEVKFIEMQSLRKLNILRFIKTILEIRRLIRDRNIDLIHSNSSRATLYAGIAAKIEKVPLIWHVRIADSDVFLDRFLAGLSTQIIVVSDAVNKRFSWMKDRPSKVKTIYNGIDLAKFSPSLKGENIRREFGLKLDTPLVGTVGRLDWYKGHRYLLKAAREVVDNIPECHFLIVGDGDKRKELESLVTKLKLNNNVIFTGNRKDIPEILASLNLFVLSSISEGLGRSIIEAMAMQKAVVATNVGGIPEVVKDNVSGVLVPLKDFKVLFEAIVSLLKDNQRAKEMGKEGYKICRERFSSDLIIEKIEKLYDSLIKEKA